MLSIQLTRTGVFLALAACLAMAISLATASDASARACPGAGAAPGEARLDTIERATRCLVNQVRAGYGIRPLHRNRRLERAATKHSRAMARRHFFSHLGRHGSTPADRVRHTGYLAGARRWRVGENIAWGSGGRATPRAVVGIWWAQVEHRANILRGGFRHVGVGVVHGAPAKGYSDAATYTAVFGRR